MTRPRPVPAGPVGDVVEPPRLDDERRVAAVRRILTAGIPPDSLDRLTRLAADLLQADFAQVSLLAHEQVIASLAGRDMLPEERVSPAADSLCTITLLAGSAVSIGDARVDPRAAHLPPVVSGGVQAYLGIPLVDPQGLVLGALCVYSNRARNWSPEHVGILAELTGSVMAELELRALTADMSTSSAQLELALSAADIGSFDLDLRTRELHWDDRLIALFGYDRASFTTHWDSFAARVHPDDLPMVQVAVERAVETSGEFASEYRIDVPGAGVKWVQARGRVIRDLAGRPSRLLGAAFDYTELRSTRDRLARVLETMTDAFFSLDRQWQFSYVNSEAERVLGRPREELLGKVIWEAFPEALGTTFQVEYERAADTGQMASFEEFFEPLDTWFEVRAWPSPDGLSVYFHDITSRRRAQQEREAAVHERERAYAAAAAANTRLELLADAATRLSASLEPRAVLRELSELIVPTFGQYVVIALLAETAAPLLGTDAVEPNRVHVAHVRHAGTEREQQLTQLFASLSLTLNDKFGPGAVIRTSAVEWLPVVPDEALIAMAPNDERLGQLRDLHLGAALTVPLVSRGRCLGAIVIAEPTGGAMDRALLLDLAGRAAIALDNALLYGAERRTGITLQRSLLPRDLPHLRDVQLAKRYLPGATGAFVGGDWYQAVPRPDGVLLAMGDVMGHGMRSAARMGQLRAIVATLALEGHAPGELLSRLSESSDVLLDLELATLLVAHYSLADRTLTVASAGHPPPLLGPVGEEPQFVNVTPGPPIGTLPSRYAETVVHVPPAATLVLYTDGLVENRDETLTDGLERLRQALAEVKLPPELVCDHILRELGRAFGADDDIALLVMSHT